MEDKVVISMCDLTGHLVDPWVENGYRAILVDPQHPEGVTVHGQVTKIGGVIDHRDTYLTLRRAVEDSTVAFCAGFPPCTDLAVSGARWFEEKRNQDPAFQFKAMQVVWQCHTLFELIGCPYFIENPVSQISSLWRKPDHWFHPHFFTEYEPNDNYTKKTCLWTGGGFRMPRIAKNSALGEPDDRIHKAPPGEQRANFRSATPRGFAKAVYLANTNPVHGTDLI